MTTSAGSRRLPRASWTLRSLSAALALACSHADPRSVADASAAPAPDDGGGTLLATASARRCGECHGTIEEEWRGSAHARSETSPLFVAMKNGAKDETCLRCHGPVSAAVGKDSPLWGEGVTCDACHAMSEARAERAGAAFTLNLTDNTKYGPVCDAKNHYFHKVACSPLHGESRQCGGCHLWYAPTKLGTTIPVFTDYEEWEASSYGQTGIVCQDCHMPGRSAETAVGSRKRPTVSHHGLLGLPTMPLRAVEWTVNVRGDEAQLHASIELRNEGAAHAIPTGLPGRTLVVRVSVVDPGGKVVDAAERAYARVLVDDTGKEVPFYSAVRVGSDTRIPAGGARTATFDLNAPAVGELRAEVRELDIAPALAQALNVPPSSLSSPGKDAMLTASVPFGRPNGRRGRELLPKTLKTGKR